MTININIRKCPMMLEIYAVLGRYENGKYLCYCLNDGIYFESDSDFLKRFTKVVKKGIPYLLDVVKMRYTDECINVVYNLRYVTKL